MFVMYRIALPQSLPSLSRHMTILGYSPSAHRLAASRVKNTKSLTTPSDLTCSALHRLIVAMYRTRHRPSLISHLVGRAACCCWLLEPMYRFASIRSRRMNVTEIAILCGVGALAATHPLANDLCGASLILCWSGCFSRPLQTFTHFHLLRIVHNRRFKLRDDRPSTASG